jgi:hypothetical protein
LTEESELVPPEYKSFVKNSGFYKVNLGDVSNIDCRGALYLQKCRFVEMNGIDPVKFIKTLRKIKLTVSGPRLGPAYSKNYTNVLSHEMHPVGKIGQP